MTVTMLSSAALATTACTAAREKDLMFGRERRLSGSGYWASGPPVAGGDSFYVGSARRVVPTPFYGGAPGSKYLSGGFRWQRRKQNPPYGSASGTKTINDIL